MVDEVGCGWHQPFGVSPLGKVAVVGPPGYLYEAPALEPHAIPRVDVAKCSLVLGAARKFGRGSEAQGLMTHLRAEHDCAFYRRAACLPQRLVESAVEFLCPRRSQARENLQHGGYIHRLSPCCARRHPVSLRSSAEGDGYVVGAGVEAAGDERVDVI